MNRALWFLMGALTIFAAMSAILFLGASGFSARAQPGRLSARFEEKAG